MGHTTILLIVSVLVVSSAAWMFDDSPFPGFAPPKVFWPFGNFPFGQSSFPSTVQNIEQTQPKPGQSYSGMVVTSNNGKTSILANIDGKVYKIDPDTQPGSS
nr:seroin 1A [Andraca theae]